MNSTIINALVTDFTDYDYDDELEDTAGLDEVSDRDLQILLGRLENYFQKNRPEFVSKEVRLERFKNVFDTLGIILVYD